MAGRVDFYRLTRDPAEQLVPLLAEKLLAGGGRVVVVARDGDARQRLDTALWAARPASFLPHGMADAPDAAGEPILIAPGLDTPPANGARHVLLADGEWRDDALGFDRSFLLFDNSRIDDARAAWRKLNAAGGCELHFWKQDDRGRWSEGP